MLDILQLLTFKKRNLQGMWISLINGTGSYDVLLLCCEWIEDIEGKISFIFPILMRFFPQSSSLIDCAKEPRTLLLDGFQICKVQNYFERYSIEVHYIFLKEMVRGDEDLTPHTNWLLIACSITSELKD